jgi:PKD repeat protein
MMDRRIQHFILAVIGLIFFGVITGEANAASVYVSPNGSDSNNGSIGSPVGTPAHALGMVSSGDTIYLRAGTYQITHMLSLGTNNLTLASYPGESAAIVGGINDLSGLIAILYITANNVTVQGLEIQGASYYGIKLESNTGTVIRSCRIHDTGRDNVKMYMADSVTFESCDMGPTGIRDPSDAQCINSVACNSTVVRKCHLHNAAQNGVYLKGGSHDGVIEDNLIENVGYAGILLGQDTDQVFMRDGVAFEALNCVARNNIIMGAGGAGVGTFSGYNVRFENNTCYDVAQNLNAGLYVVANSRGIQPQQVTFKNNVVVVKSSRPMFFIVSLADQLLSDYNVYFKPNGGSYGFWEEASGSNYWSSLSNWQSGMNSDRNSTTTDPMMDSSNMCKPVSGSPVIDRGTTISEVPTDYFGNPRPQGQGYDIGAIEVSAAPAPHGQPQVTITPSNTSGNAPLPVSFTANASDPTAQISSYSWDFGDGGHAATGTPQHTYNSPGSFPASVMVTDSMGATASASIVITVSAQQAHQPPQVSVSASVTSGTAPLTVNFASNVSDPASQSLSYLWNFGDGQLSTSNAPQHLYTSAGNFTAVLTETDSYGSSGTASIVIRANAKIIVGGSQSISWTNVVGAKASGSSVQKTTPSEWGNSGATSRQSLSSGSGYIEFTAVETNTERMCGFSTRSANQFYGDIAFAVHLNTGRAFYVTESGKERGYFGDYNSGDVFRVTIGVGSVQYSRNGKVFYTSSVAPAYPLWAGAVMDGISGTIANSVMSGSSGNSNLPPVVQVLAPTRQAVLTSGTSYSVQWSMLANADSGQSPQDSSSTTVDILLSLDGGNSWQAIAQGLPTSTTSYSWSVPAAKTRNGLIRVVSNNDSEPTGSGISNTFRIKQAKHQ